LPEPSPTLRLEGVALEVLEATPARLGTLATVNADGTPHQVVIWYAVRPDGTILLNSRVGRVWPTNLLRDPRCTLAVTAGTGWVGVRGTVTAMTDHEQAYQDIMALARRYDGDDPAKLAEARRVFRPQRRISFHLRPQGLIVHL